VNSAWQTTFVAVSVLLGEPPDAIAEALDERGLADASAALRAMTSGARDDRARALARALSAVALAVDAARFS
jgi:hypothetical protein